MDTTQIDKVIEKHGCDGSSLIAVLQEVQREEGYLPRKTLSRLSQKMELPLSRLYALATFYRSFSLTPTGRHRISVCLGTACHVRGGKAILNRLERNLSIRAGETTADRRFTLRTVRCLGCCSIGPVVRIGNETFGRVRQDELDKIVARYR
jgi:NADH-quinone oxidoreductase subunit E